VLNENPRSVDPVGMGKLRPALVAIGLACLAFGSLGTGAPAAWAETVLYRTADGQQGIVDDPGKVPPGAEIIPERTRTLVKVPAGALLSPDGAPEARPAARRNADESPAPQDGVAPSAEPSARMDPAGPDARVPATRRATGFPASDAAGETPETPFPPKEKPGRAEIPSFHDDDAPPPIPTSPLALRERCADLGLYGFSCTPDAIGNAERWRLRARRAREAREQSELRLAALKESYEKCEHSGNPSVLCPRSELEAAERKLATSQRKEEEIEDECRIAECLPGWLRE
jgi:hypothetical protein